MTNMSTNVNSLLLVILILTFLETLAEEGVAAVFDSSLSIDPKPKLNYNLFESLTLSLSQHSQFC